MLPQTNIPTPIPTPTPPPQTTPRPDVQPAPTPAAAYDFSLLTAPVTDTERTAFRQLGSGKTGTGQYWIFALIGAVFAGFFSMAFVGSMLSASGADATTTFTVVFVTWLGLIALLIAVVKWGERLREEKLVKLHRFATAHGMTHVHDRNDPGYNGMVFDEGHSRVLNNALIMADGTEIGNYTYVTGGGKNRSTHTFAFVRIPLERALPHMVLDAKGNNFFGLMSNLPDTFGKDQTLSLEGDFDTHFTLYAPKQYERDALYVFTPDVMAALIDNGSGYDMEAIDRDLYIYRNNHFDLLNGEQLSSLFKIIDTIASELRAQTKRYADERVGDRSANIIAPQGARLKKGVNWIVVGIVALFVGYHIAESFMLMQEAWYVFYIIPYLVIPMFILWFIFKKRRRP